MLRSERSETRIGLQLGGDLDRLVVFGLSLEGDGCDSLDDTGGLGGLSLGGCGLGLSGENNEVGFIELKALSINVDALGALVGTTVINSDSDGLSLFRGDTSSLPHSQHKSSRVPSFTERSTYLELFKREATSQTDLQVVAIRGAVNNRAEGTSHGAREDGSSLRLASITSAYFAGRLVEPSTHTLVPILSEVIVDDHVVVLYHGEWIGRMPGRG